jgi:glycerol-3-phosphate dehydrogenase subunit C
MKEQAKIEDKTDFCIRCATCMEYCPVLRVTDRFPGPKQAGPGGQRFRGPDVPPVDRCIDLCIGCTMCELVCTSGVDIYRLNLMAKAKYYDEHGLPFRDRVLSHFNRWIARLSWAVPMVNRLSRSNSMRSMLDRLFDLDKRRPLPDFEIPTFRQWFGRGPDGHRVSPDFSGNARVGYFYGCFTNVSEVDVGKAVVGVLEENGVHVAVPVQDCCGIPMLGSGDLESARSLGHKNLLSLGAAIDSGMDIVYSSSSCGYMIRHEYANVLGIPGAERLSKRTYDICEYLVALHEKGSLKPPSEIRRRLVYFSPCHVRAMGMGLPALELLKLIPGIHLELIDEGCCGLGGLYGFKKEKYDISMEIGEDLARRLLDSKPHAVVTDCEGCRLQIRHLTGLPVIHPIQILRDAYQAG